MHRPSTVDAPHLESAPMERDFAGYLNDRAAPPPTVPTRTLACLRYLSHGLTYQQTADAMGIGHSSVLDYVKLARLELRAKNRTHAVAIALRLGLID